MTTLSELILQELIVKDFRSENEKSHYVAAWKDKMFVFDSNTPTEELNTMLAHFKDHPNSSHFSNISVENLFDNLRDQQDLVTGIWYPKDRYLSVSTISISPTTSRVLRDVARQLKVKKVGAMTDDSDGDGYAEYPIKKLLGKLPDILYHGTSTVYIESILKHGLLTRQESGADTNWKGFEHENVIFFSADKENAYFQGTQTAMEQGGFPIFLEVRIPFKSLIIPDADADPQRTVDDYAHLEPDRYSKYGISPEQMSLHTGRIGYRGKILPQHILWIYFKVYDYQEKKTKMKKMRPKTLQRVLDRFDFEDLRYRLGIVDARGDAP